MVRKFSAKDIYILVAGAVLSKFVNDIVDYTKLNSMSTFNGVVGLIYDYYFKDSFDVVFVRICNTTSVVLVFFAIAYLYLKKASLGFYGMLISDVIIINYSIFGVISIILGKNYYMQLIADQGVIIGFVLVTALFMSLERLVGDWRSLHE